MQNEWQIAIPLRSARFVGDLPSSCKMHDELAICEPDPGLHTDLQNARYLANCPVRGQHPES
jgi:hypothetical protein